MKKNILLLLLTITLSNCGSTKRIEIETETQDWINTQNFIVVKPDNWRPVKHHGYVGYTPLKKGANFFNNLVSVFQFKLKEKPDFKEFSMNQIRESNEAMNITTKEILKEKDRFGYTYIHIYESTLNGEIYKNYTKYFEHNGEYYSYNYSSLKHKYNKHLKEAMSMLNSIEFK
ncbi:hypothetical protein [Corallibacter sp.]|uniref:hypothetical protein n=1 Tax=Corallibacter sp. TaxID=2038084 RepID=UPI003A8D6310